MKVSRRVTILQYAILSVITRSSNTLYQLKDNLHLQDGVLYSTQAPNVTNYESKYSKADNSRLNTKTEHTYQLHKSSGMASVSFSTLALEVKLSICDYLSIDCLTKVALTCKAYKKVVDTYKDS